MHYAMDVPNELRDSICFAMLRQKAFAADRQAFFRLVKLLFSYKRRKLARQTDFVRIDRICDVSVEMSLVEIRSHWGLLNGDVMKALVFLISLLAACIAWTGALVDFVLANVSDLPRPHLVPGRTFIAAYRITRAYLLGEPLQLQTFRFREYPRQKCF